MVPAPLQASADPVDKPTSYAWVLTKLWPQEIEEKQFLVNYPLKLVGGLSVFGYALSCGVFTSGAYAKYFIIDQDPDNTWRVEGGWWYWHSAVAMVCFLAGTYMNFKLAENTGRDMIRYVTWIHSFATGLTAPHKPISDLMYPNYKDQRSALGRCRKALLLLAIVSAAIGAEALACGAFDSMQGLGDLLGLGETVNDISNWTCYVTTMLAMTFVFYDVLAKWIAVATGEKVQQALCDLIPSWCQALVNIVLIPLFV